MCFSYVLHATEVTGDKINYVIALTIKGSLNSILSACEGAIKSSSTGYMRTGPTVFGITFITTFIARFALQPKLIPDF